MKVGQQQWRQSLRVCRNSKSELRNEEKKKEKQNPEVVSKNSTVQGKGRAHWNPAHSSLLLLWGFFTAANKNSFQIPRSGEEKPNLQLSETTVYTSIIQGPISSNEGWCILIHSAGPFVYNSCLHLLSCIGVKIYTLFWTQEVIFIYPSLLAVSLHNN